MTTHMHQESIGIFTTQTLKLSTEKMVDSQAVQKWFEKAVNKGWLWFLQHVGYKTVGKVPCAMTASVV